MVRESESSPPPSVRDPSALAEHLESLVELSVDAIVSIDDAQNIVLFNRGAEEIFGYSRAEVVGREVSILIPGRFRDAHVGDVRGFGSSTIDSRMMGEREGIVGLKKDGTEFRAEASIFRSTVQGERRYTAQLRDVTQRVRREEALREMYGAATDPSRGLEARLQSLLELGGRHLGMERGIVSRVTAGHYEVLNVVPETDGVTAGNVYLLDHTYCAQTLHSLRPVGFSRASGSEWETHPCYLRTRMEAYIGAPLVVGNDTFGTLNFFSLEPRTRVFTDWDYDLVKLMALLIGRELEAEERREIGRLLAHGRDALSRSSDFTAIRGIVARLGIPTLADACSVYIPLASGKILHVKAGGEKGAVEEALLDVTELVEEGGKDHPALQVLQTRQTVTRRLPVAREGGDEQPSTPSGWPFSTGFRSGMMIPVEAGGETIAALALLSSNPAMYGPREVVTAQELGTLAGFALAHLTAHQTLQDDVKAREDLLAFVSHDLGNPIATISMVSERLLAFPSEEDRRKDSRYYIEGIAEAAGRMERLVQDLLEVQLLEDGRRAIRRTPLLVESTLDEAVRAFEQTALTKSIGLERRRVEGTSGDDWSIKGDRDRLLEVLSNLLDNAMKFTDPGGRIQIGAELHGNEAVFFVSDTGVGIAPEHVPHLFDRYVQAHEKRRAGAGLGLAIAKEIVEGHGGSIWCESEPGQGSSFSFSIPVG